MAKLVSAYSGLGKTWLVQHQNELGLNVADLCECNRGCDVFCNSSEYDYFYNNIVNYMPKQDYIVYLFNVKFIMYLSTKNFKQYIVLPDLFDSYTRKVYINSKISRGDSITRIQKDLNRFDKLDIDLVKSIKGVTVNWLKGNEKLSDFIQKIY